ncbi:hypothetical protein I5Q06_01955 [Serratia ureilytica]|uniref:hypothetical protein n=1 Tax=Serratia ureilytica TaxID=300181 RepID=UPI0018D99ADC|nr:hypothetical protein [Serratia ureilytica]MBH3318134.1 hypothetical protein [Serratia ureilytica]
MSWFGVPFLFNTDGMASNSYVYLNKIPKIIVDSVFDERTLIAPALTALIPGAIAAVAMIYQNRSIKEERKNQLNIARETIKSQVVTSSRQDWINRFSDLASDFIALVEPLLNAKYGVKVAIAIQSRYSGMTPEELAKNSALLNLAEKSSKELAIKNNEHSTIRQEIISKVSRLKIMMNPDEMPCVVIIKLIDEILVLISNMREYGEVDLPSMYENVNFKTTELTKAVQVFLKSEWDRVKEIEL